jgi:prepilin-type N-terminal cleavage/methylation domain-containing protein
VSKANSGFTLIELMIVIAVIAILALLAVPNLLAARLGANETSAIDSLRNLATSQCQFQTSVSVDNDADGNGEYGSLGELAGVVPLNARGVGLPQPLDPPILAATFQQINPAGEIARSGYFFTIFLPDAGFDFVQENPGGGPGAAIDDDSCEAAWCAYAWPIDARGTGNRAFFVNQRGELLQTRMDAVTYSGSGAINPANANAVYVGATMDTDVGLAVGGVPASNDGNLWVPVQ